MPLDQRNNRKIKLANKLKAIPANPDGNYLVKFDLVNDRLLLGDREKDHFYMILTRVSDLNDLVIDYDELNDNLTVSGPSQNFKLSLSGFSSRGAIEVVPEQEAVRSYLHRIKEHYDRSN